MSITNTNGHNQFFSSQGGLLESKSSPLPGKVPRPPMPQPHSMEPDETTDLEELEQFAKTFKQRRIKLGKCILTTESRSYSENDSFLILAYIYIFNEFYVKKEKCYILRLFDRIHTGRCWSRNGKTLWKWLLSDDDFKVRSS